MGKPEPLDYGQEQKPAPKLLSWKMRLHFGFLGLIGFGAAVASQAIILQTRTLWPWAMFAVLGAASGTMCAVLVWRGRIL